jgi:hypothetical protein
MLDLAQINDIATQAATSVLSRHAVGIHDVTTQEIADDWGKEALEVTIVFSRGTADRAVGPDALDTLVAINKALQARHEDRFAFTRYTTEEELERRADPEC